MIPGIEWRIEKGDWRSHAEQRAAVSCLLRRLLGEESAVGHAADGRPYLPQHPELAISISHCRMAVAVAVSSRGAVGIDVECRRRIIDGLVGRVCTGKEHAAVQAAADPTMAFLSLWTQKEAVLKLRGTGIQGFGSMVHALGAGDIIVEQLPCGDADIVAALATFKA